VNVPDKVMRPEQSNEDKLLKLVSAGDQQAFRQVFHVHAPRVYGFALKLTRSQILAEEIVQDVFVKLWIHRESLTGIQHLQAYLHTLTRNHTLNVLKRIALEETAKAVLKRRTTEAHFETEETVNFRESQSRLNRAIDQLPPQQRTVYSLCQNEGLKYEEVAQRLNISRLTVKTHMQQALRALKAHFSGFATLLIWMNF
jgi:RNA polymerase sigma-70 factor (family 1)